MTTLGRLLAKVSVGDACWEWTGCRERSGYGSFYMGQRRAYAHRAAYQLLVGPIPDGLQVDHLCRNRACVRPDHLEPVTQRENILRGASPAAHRAQQTHCLRGHRYEPSTTQWKRGRRECLICSRLMRRLPGGRWVLGHGLHRKPDGWGCRCGLSYVPCTTGNQRTHARKMHHQHLGAIRTADHATLSRRVAS